MRCSSMSKSFYCIELGLPKWNNNNTNHIIFAWSNDIWRVSFVFDHSSNSWSNCKLDSSNIVWSLKNDVIVLIKMVLWHLLFMIDIKSKKSNQLKWHLCKNTTKMSSNVHASPEVQPNINLKITSSNFNEKQFQTLCSLKNLANIN